MDSKEKESIQLLQGTLDLIVLRTLAAMGPRHAYQIATRLQQVSDSLLTLNQGTLYPALVRLNSMVGFKARGEKQAILKSSHLLGQPRLWQFEVKGQQRRRLHATRTCGQIPESLHHECRTDQKYGTTLGCCSSDAMGFGCQRS